MLLAMHDAFLLLQFVLIFIGAFSFSISCHSLGLLVTRLLWSVCHQHTMLHSVFLVNCSWLTSSALAPVLIRFEGRYAACVHQLLEATVAGFLAPQVFLGLCCRKLMTCRADVNDVSC